MAGRGERLFRLAQLELELAILREVARPGSGDWDAPARSARRLLLEEAGFPERDDVRLFLVRLELRRGRTQTALTLLDELEASHPATRALCQGRLLRGEAWSAAGRAARAAEGYRSALLKCEGADEKQQARYKLAWALLKDGRVLEGADELRRLLDERLPGRLREHALGDLVLAWSHASPPANAAHLLLTRGGADLGGRLLQQLGERLLQGHRLAPLLRLTASPPAQLTAQGRLQLLTLRLKALARLGRPEALELEISALSKPAPPGLGAVVATSRLELAARLARSKDAADLRQAEQLYQRVLDGSSGPDFQLAQLSLGELRRRRGDREAAVAALEAAARAPGPRRAAASYALLQLLEELLASKPASQRGAARARLCRAAWRHAQEFPSASETAEVLLLLATEEQQRGDFGAAIRAGELFIATFARHSRRAEAVRLLLRALEHGAQWARAYDLAVAQQRSNTSRDNTSSDDFWRETAARAALRHCQELGGRGDWNGAELWVSRAQQQASGKLSLTDDVRLTAAFLALRRQRFTEAEQLYRTLAGGAGAHRGRALLLLAELDEARGAFIRGARGYATAAKLAAGPGERLDLLRRSASAALAGHDVKAARDAVLEIVRVAERPGLPAADRLRWQLRAAALLLRVGPAGRPHALGLGRQLEAEKPAAAAHILIRAARGARLGQARALLERALELAGPMRRGKPLTAEAAEAQLALARLERQRSTAPNGSKRRLLLLQQQLPQLLELLAAAEPRWAAEAGLEVAQTYAELAATLRAGRVPRGMRGAERERYRAALESRAKELEVRRTQILSKLARLAGERGGLRSATLRAARLLADAGAAKLRADYLPPSAPAVEPALTLFRSGRAAESALAATRMLELLGERDDLLCVRALSALSRDRPAAADRDLRAALEANPRSRCARMNLAVLSLWRGDSAGAREVLAGVQPVDDELRTLLAPSGTGSPVAGDEPGWEAALQR